MTQSGGGGWAPEGDVKGGGERVGERKGKTTKKSSRLCDMMTMAFPQTRSAVLTKNLERALS